MADKNDTYYCTWKRERDGTCTGWEIRNRELTVSAPGLRMLQRGLGMKISQHYDDHEAALHFDPPLSEEGDPAWFVDALVEIAWNASFAFRPSADTAYSNGRCDRCGGGLGPRTSRPLEVDEINRNTDGASSQGSNEPPPTSGMPGRLAIISDEFLQALTAAERATFDARPIKMAQTEGQRFYELVPHSCVALGAIKELEVFGWRCDRCGRRVFSHGREIGHVVCRRQLPTDSPGFFFAGSDWDVHLYCTRERWRSFAGTKWAKKLTGEPLAVVDEALFDPDPLLGTLDEIEEFRRVHGFKVPFKPQPRM